MPYGFGSSAVFTSSSGGDIGGGRAYTRLRGPVLVGQSLDKAGWPLGSTQPPHVANVSTQLADNLISPAGGGVFVSTGTPTGLLYATRTSATIIAAGSTGNAPTPAVLGGAATVWDDGAKSFATYTSATSFWVIPNAGPGQTQTTSAPAFVTYIPVTSGTGNIVAAGSTANAPTVLATGFAALIWDAAKGTLAIYDPFSSAWTWPHIPAGAASTTATIVWTACSS